MKYNTIGTGSLDKKSSFTIYADLDIPNNKMANSEPEVAAIRGQLEIVQKELNLRTKRCRQLVAEFTRRLQEKEQQYQSEKALRDDQLAKVLRALIIFEARLKQEQKFISHQLKEKDCIIKKQNSEIKKLLSNQYCKNCNQYYSTSPNLESLDSSSEYVATDYQSSNFESLDSSSDIYATISEKSYNQSESESKNIYVKNKGKDSLGRRTKKFPHRKSVGTYFEVLKMRSDNTSPCSNEDNTSNDYDNLDSLPPESINAEKIDSEENENDQKSKITESIPVFDAEINENDNWYASASDQEDEAQRDIYRNNPVLECMNQILLQNINDINSPPKTPNIERKSLKKVKFSDEESPPLTKQNVDSQEKHDYYETPIQKVPNFYETPQSIYSNDYEQILSEERKAESVDSGSKNHFYVDLDSKSESDDKPDTVRKSKILRTPPALPPKPANLMLKYRGGKKEENESEPDYCSISELNLPTKQTFKKINVVAEINPPNSQDVISKLEKAKVNDDPGYDPVGDTVVKKCVEKLNIQLAKQTPIKTEQEIPKLPQVSEILIPEEENVQQEERISHDNYVKNNSQILKTKNNKQNRRSIIMGTSVSNLITGFNNQQLTEIKKPKYVFSSFDNSQNFDKNTKKEETPNFEFDLSQNFEEFKLDDCEIEEYNVPEDEDKSEEVEEKNNKVELIRATNDFVPSLNVTSVELLKKQLELQKEDGLKKSEPTYEHFLECTGLSSKAILTPSRLLSNHKSMLKPKDIKLRSKVKANHNLIERHSTSTIKYWSEPYI